jgi:hypothetical protein
LGEHRGGPRRPSPAQFFESFSLTS